MFRTGLVLVLIGMGACAYLIAEQLPRMRRVLARLGISAFFGLIAYLLLFGGVLFPPMR